MPLNTPVAFFIFNRPDVTEMVFREIAKAQPATLLVVADGPRHTGDAELCRRSRAVIDAIDWPCRVLTDYSDSNLGCKRRMSSGLDWVFSQVEEAIILEDDCVPAPDFFPFCEWMLQLYRDDPRVAMIAGTNYLLDGLDARESYVFSRYFAIWGWATWRRAWQHYDIALRDWESQKAARQLSGFYTQPFMRDFLTTSFDLAHQNKIDTWDTQWFYSCLFQSGLCIVPRVNLISNIGVVGVHSSTQDRNHFKPVFTLDTTALRHPEQVFPDQRYDAPFFAQQFSPPPRSLPRRAVSAIKRIAKQFLRRRNRNGH